MNIYEIYMNTYEIHMNIYDLNIYIHNRFVISICNNGFVILDS
jgi:hypothetical protein